MCHQIVHPGVIYIAFVYTRLQGLVLMALPGSAVAHSHVAFYGILSSVGTLWGFFVREIEFLPSRTRLYRRSVEPTTIWAGLFTNSYRQAWDRRDGANSAS